MQSQRRRVAQYEYRAPDGNLIALKDREEWIEDGEREKSFIWRLPDGKPGLQGRSVSLYRAERLISTALDQPVDVVEGEKCVHALERVGMAALSAPGGAGTTEVKWREFAPLLRDRVVRLWPDNDETGRRYMQMVARTLLGVASDVLWVDLVGMVPEKGDVADLPPNVSRTAVDTIVACAVPAIRRLEPLEGSARVVSVADVVSEEVDFLWDPFIPRGKLTLVEGDPGIGKTTYLLAVSAGVSLGIITPDGKQLPAENVLILAGEDGPADTIRPRLERMCADLSRIKVVTGIVRRGGDAPLTLDEEGLAALDDAMRIERPGLVCIDPLVAYLGAGVDMYRANEVRAITGPLAALAQRHHAGMLGTRHLNKSAGTQAAYRGLGSIDFYAIARSVLLVGLHPHLADQRVVVHTKSNLAALGPTHAFTVEEKLFRWCGTVDVSAEDLLSAQGEDRSMVMEAADYLKMVLSDGAVASVEVLSSARQNGIAERTLRRAFKSLGGMAQREGVPGIAGAGSWTWRLPGR